MNNRSAFKIFGLTLGLSILASSAMADSQDDNLFLPSVYSMETITVAYRGKPPYRNRQQVRAKLKTQQAQAARAKNLDKTELSALEISEKDSTSIVGKSTRKRYGHPYHR